MNARFVPAFLISLTMIAFAISSRSAFAVPTPSQEKIEYFVFIQGDSDFRGFIRKDKRDSYDTSANSSELIAFEEEFFREVKALKLPAHVGVHVYYDTDSNYGRDFASEYWSKCGNTIQIESETFGETNSADPAYLKKLVGKRCFGQEKTSRVFVYWGHGAGFESMLGFDASHDSESSSIIRLLQAVSPEPFDAIFLEACLMSQLESLLLLKPYARNVFSSQYEIGLDEFSTEWMTRSFSIGFKTPEQNESVYRAAIEEIKKKGRSVGRPQVALQWFKTDALEAVVRASNDAFDYVIEESARQGKSRDDVLQIAFEEPLWDPAFEDRYGSRGFLPLMDYLMNRSDERAQTIFAQLDQAMKSLEPLTPALLNYYLPVRSNQYQKMLGEQFLFSSKTPFEGRLALWNWMKKNWRKSP